MNDQGLGQIPNDAPAPSYPYVLTVNVLPLADLGAQGDLGRYLRLPTDLPPVLAVLSGISEAGPRRVSLTPDGAVRIAQVGSGLTHIDAHEGTLSDTNPHVVQFGELVDTIFVMSDDQDISVEHSIDGNNYDAPFTIRVGERLFMDLTTLSLRLTNTSGFTTRYRLWGLYF